MIVLEILCVLLSIYWYILIVRIILSFVTRLPEPIMPLDRGVRAVTDPVLTPLRRLIPPLQTGAMALDLSPIILFIAIRILQSVLCSGGF